MIIHLNTNTSAERANEIADNLSAFLIHNGSKHVLITGASMKEVPSEIAAEVSDSWVFDNDIQLASRKYIDKKREVTIGKVTIGGDTNKTLLIGGPCSVESEEQIRQSAGLLNDLGLTSLRGGCYKPRTSPYSCLLYTSPSPRDRQKSRMPSSA